MKRVALIAVLAAVGLPAGAGAIVPPKDCGTIHVKGKKYNVKADQMRCADARRYSSSYLTSSKRKPAGYRCNRYNPKETKLVFRCAKGIKNFFAIRR
jgi:hypothetical protein